MNLKKKNVHANNSHTMRRWEKNFLQENEWSTGKANMKQLLIYPVYVGWHDENSFGFFFLLCTQNN